jgi:hypothetical protein
MGSIFFRRFGLSAVLAIAGVVLVIYDKPWGWAFLGVAVALRVFQVLRGRSG